MTPGTLAILGSGRMGYAIASALIARKEFSAKKIIMADPMPGARRRATRLGCSALPDAFEAAAGSNNILLAVKPQRIEEVSKQIRRAVWGKRIISILAGTPRSRIMTLLPGARIIRVMPNTPLLAASGATVIARDGVSKADMQFTKRLFGSVGKVWVAPEKWMNAVTALSGSGPALFCAFLEACIAAGSENGLPGRMAEELAIQTFAGTAALLKNTRPGVPPLTPRALREMVTSPGGTTEAALGVFVRRRLPAVIRESIRAAIQRGMALSR